MLTATSRVLACIWEKVRPGEQALGHALRRTLREAEHVSVPWAAGTHLAWRPCADDSMPEASKAPPRLSGSEVAQERLI